MSVPPGYERLLLAHAVAVARSDVVAGIRGALMGADGTRTTLHEFASRDPRARPLQGRGTSYALHLPPGSRRVVVRHNWHGGAFAAVTRDRFLAPTRAPHELAVSLELQRRGIATPDVLAYVLYPPGGIVQRADVATAEIPSARDLADILSYDSGDARDAAIEATARLVADMSRAGARHHDLNARNVLITPRGAVLLDVDRVSLDARPAAALDGNLSRLARSLAKWRDRFGAPITTGEISTVQARARELAAGG